MKNLKILISILCSVGVLFFFSCKSDSTSKKEYSSGLYLENMDKSVNPGDNFQMYVNGKWINETEIPSDKSSYGIFGILDDESKETVKKIIESAAATESGGGTDEQKVGGLYASFMDMETRNSLGATPIKSELEKIDAIKDYSDLAKYFSYANKLGYEVPFGIFVFGDLKKPTHHALYSWQGGLGLPDREYYFKDDEKSKSIREEYVNHIEKMLTLAEVENANAAAKEIMDLETKIADKHLKKEETRDMMAMYNAFPIAELDEMMPDFSCVWISLCEAGVEVAPVLPQTTSTCLCPVCVGFIFASF